MQHERLEVTVKTTDWAGSSICLRSHEALAQCQISWNRPVQVIFHHVTLSGKLRLSSLASSDGLCIEASIACGQAAKRAQALTKAMEEGKVAGRDPSLEQLVALRQTCAEMQVNNLLKSSLLGSQSGPSTELHVLFIDLSRCLLHMCQRSMCVSLPCRSVNRRSKRSLLRAMLHGQQLQQGFQTDAVCVTISYEQNMF